MTSYSCAPKHKMQTQPNYPTNSLTVEHKDPTQFIPNPATGYALLKVAYL